MALLSWLTPSSDEHFNSLFRNILPPDEELRMFRNFVTVTEKGLAAALEKFQTENAAAPVDPKEEYANDIEQWRVEIEAELGATHPNYAWSSILITVYGYLENQMIAIVGHMKETATTPGRIEGDGKGIFGVKNYLKTHFSMDVTLDKYWPDIEDLNKIRNCFTHDRGIIGPSPGNARDEGIRTFAAHNPDLMTISSSDQIWLSIAFINKAINSIQLFLDHFIDEARLWIADWNRAHGLPAPPRNVTLLIPRVPFQDL